tara:strand:+ start:1402 stop:1521 length:120 start_codon:yes stop_codon:yes gene_type:complete
MNPIINSLGSKVHCPAIKKAAPKYPIREATFWYGVSLFI